MSWFPGGRWSPIRQGISAGIGDTAAGGGVSDQIRRLMQSAPAPGQVRTGPGYRETISPELPIDSAAVGNWTIPESAVNGFRLMAVSVSISAAPPEVGDWFRPPFFGGWERLSDNGNGGAQVVWAAAAGASLGVSFPDALAIPPNHGTVRFSVLAW